MTALWRVLILTLCLCCAPASLFAQGTSPLRQIQVDGLKILTPDQVIALSQLQIGAQVGRDDLQAASDKLVQSGMFAHVKYDFRTVADQVNLVFHVEESPQLPVVFDNFALLADSELNDAIRSKLSFYNGTLPEGGTVVDVAADAIKELLTSRKQDPTVEHQVTGNPLGEGSVQLFSSQGTPLKIAKLDFSDPSLSTNPVVQQHISELIGKPFSRVAINIFLAENVRPYYLKQGFLHVTLGPAEIRLTSRPNEKLPDSVPVFIPVTTGPVYHFAGIQWTGNKLISSDALNSVFGAKVGDLANGLIFESGFDRVQEEYGKLGYLDAKVDSEPVYDETAHTVAYRTNITEGVQFRMGRFVLTGISLTGERIIIQTFPNHTGDVFDKLKYEDYLLKLQTHREQVFGQLPIHYDTVGHWLRTDPSTGVVDVLLDFQ